MQCPQCVHPNQFAMVPTVVSNDTVTKPAERFFRRSNVVKIQSLVSRHVHYRTSFKPTTYRDLPFIEVYELRTSIVEISPNVGSGWRWTPALARYWTFLWKKDDQNRCNHLLIFQPPTDDELWNQLAEGLREFYPTRYALWGLDLYNQIESLNC